MTRTARSAAGSGGSANRGCSISCGSGGLSVSSASTIAMANRRGMASRGCDRPGAMGSRRGADDLLRLFLLGEAEKVQAAVRAKVKPQTWDAFWLVAVCDWTVERTAKALGMTHTAVYAARERVAADAPRRRQARLGPLGGRILMAIRAGRAGNHVVLPWGGDPALARHRCAR